ncbi:MAG: M48 family metallopeptidase [Armatimonadota bacterium]
MSRAIKPVLWLIWLVGVGLLLSGVVPAGAKTTEEERRIGKEAAEQIANEYKFVTDPKVLERVERVGRIVADAAKADEPDLTYTFAVIDSSDVNAFCLPGGYVYIYKGLLDKIESDDELAGVIAHEIAHAARHHVRSLIEKSQKLSLPTLAAMVVVLASGSQTASDAVMVSQWIAQAKLSGYSVKYETEADAAALEYILKTPYSPVGLLTFMERLANEEYWRPKVDWGIYRTHPLSEERAAALEKALITKGIPLARRHVLRSGQVQVKELPGGELAELTLAGRTLAVVGADGGLSAAERAAVIAKAVNAVLDTEPMPQEVGVGKDRKSVVIRRHVVFTVTEADAVANNKTPEGTATEFCNTLRAALFTELLNNPRRRL